MKRWSWLRWWGIVCKEFLQLRRDRVTFGMIIGVPIMQMLLFGFAINTDPRHLPLATLPHESTAITRSVIAALEHSRYFDYRGELPGEAAADAALQRGDVMFVLSFPPGFTRDVLRGDQPQALIEADATDPVASAAPLAAIPEIINRVVARDVPRLASAPAAFGIRIQRRYNPEGLTQYNIIPGLMGVVLSMTLVMMTGLAMTRERERGTMENLLAMPVAPLEVITGKIVPYIVIGFVQATLILLGAHWLFHVPMQGALPAVYLGALLFIAASLAVGITLSSLARNQLQAMQLTIVYFLPNILLSGFMFPFAGMPRWAQWLGELLPLTHFTRMMRALLLKGAGWGELWPQIWPQLAFTLVMLVVAVLAYRRTLD
ncbi:ABC transporter permease [Chitinibacteraceae bacterium HSL-7]